MLAWKEKECCVVEKKNGFYCWVVAAAMCMGFKDELLLLSLGSCGKWIWMRDWLFVVKEAKEDGVQRGLLCRELGSGDGC